ncbi:MAG: hypothetical protein HYZ52_00920 [Candidatus Omnitrophica bacterium]|nr:hypothetical protein [Candidatus Omnitrophota bacterium]
MDGVLEFRPAESLTTRFTLKGSEEFLLDHFKGFPVMPGVLLLESARQAAARFLNLSALAARHYRLAAASEVKFGQFVRPGTRLKIFVRWTGGNAGKNFFESRIDVVEGASQEAVSGGKALSASLTLEAI